MLHSFDHLSPHSILAVEKMCVAEADEKLAVGAVGILRARHRGGPADVRLAAELGLEVGLFRATRTGAGRVASLRHETVDDPVEDDAVVEAFADELLDPCDMA